MEGTTCINNGGGIDDQEKNPTLTATCKSGNTILDASVIDRKMTVLKEMMVECERMAQLGEFYNETFKHRASTFDSQFTSHTQKK
jgi:hypothetical protein